MIHLSITIICLIYIVYTSSKEFFSRKKKENAYLLINTGILCHHCKDLTTFDILDVKNKLNQIGVKDYKLCKKCTREKSISKIISGNFIKTLIANFNFLNWGNKRVIQLSYIVWFIGLSFFIVGRSVDSRELNSIAMIIYCIQIWLINNHLNYSYVQEGYCTEKLNELK
jgi:hypothetical protein